MQQQPGPSRNVRKCVRSLTDEQISEIVNDSDSDYFDIDELDELAESESIRPPPAEIPVPQDCATPFETQPRRGQKRVREPTTDSDLGWKLNIQPSDRPLFCGQPGVNPDLDIGPDSTPIDIFRLLFTDEIFRLIQTETNRYADQQINKEKQKGPLKKKSVYTLWKNVSMKEIKIFFSIIIHMCLVRKPQLRDYWSTTPILQTSYTSSVGMSRDRFLAIFTMLHVNDNNTRIPRGQPGHEPTHKIKPILDHLTSQFRQLYTPTETLTIDEAICAFRGRVFFRVYIKGKPHKYGMKIYELCEASSGFVCNMEVYDGTHEGVENYNAPFNVVDRLCDPIKHNWYTVYMDRFFTSPKLFDHLWNSGVKAVGTIMANRKEMPKQHFSKKIKKGEKLVAQRGPLLAIKWCDVRDVFIITTAHDDNTLEMPRSRGAHQKTKPEAVVQYNKYKIGVDKSDQLLSYYSFQRKSVKWWKKLFFHLFDLAIVNSHILHQKQATQKIRLRQFLEKIADGLVAEVGTELTQQTQHGPGGRLVGRNHFPFRIPATGTKQKWASQRTCRVCADKAKHETGKTAHKYTTVYCETCDVGLCLGQCFQAFHTKAKYWE